MKVIHLVAGARPNFMKVGPLYHALAREPWCRPVFVHTGQHYDANMSGYFLEDMGLPHPHIQLGIGSGTHAEQTGRLMIAYEKPCLEARPDLIVVVGDVNSTLACAIVGKKLLMPVAHLEAGLRNGDRTMPEEINRVLIDAISDILWTPSADADENLSREGIDRTRIERVGNIMVDSLEMLRPRIESMAVGAEYSLSRRNYAVVTFHRASNVDCPRVLAEIIHQIASLAARLPLIFPVHPRTYKRLQDFNLFQRLSHAGVIVTEPMRYVRFTSLVMGAAVVVTDSGGVQEETTALGIPCLTVRHNTERPITITEGTNRLVRPENIVGAVENALALPNGAIGRPALWDGNTAARVVASIQRWLLPKFDKATTVHEPRLGFVAHAGT